MEKSDPGKDLGELVGVRVFFLLPPPFFFNTIKGQ